MFDAGKTRMIGLPYAEKNYDDVLSHFHLIPERHGRTDRQTDRIAISISHVNVLTRDKNVIIQRISKNQLVINCRTTSTRHTGAYGICTCMHRRHVIL